MAYDPVCLAFVDEENAEFTITHKGTTFFFCTGYCKKKFLENPKKYSRFSTEISVDPHVSF